MGKDKDPVEDRDDLRGKKAEVEDDLETAQAKSGSVDERIPEHYATDRVHADDPIPAAGIPQGRLTPGDDKLGEGEEILELERKAQRAPKQPG